mgnify:FL=1
MLLRNVSEPRYALVVEGVETEPQWAFLRECGCHFGQGYYFSYPVPVEQLMVGLLEAQKRH